MSTTITGRILLLGTALYVAQAAPAAGTFTDPTRPNGYAVHGQARHLPGSAGDWTLSSTLVAPDRRVAVINGHQVSEGEYLDGARVVRIEKLSALLSAAGRHITLHLLPDIVQHQP
jgi:MSHA biogenesis protein MshK